MQSCTHFVVGPFPLGADLENGGGSCKISRMTYNRKGVGEEHASALVILQEGLEGLPRYNVPYKN